MFLWTAGHIGLIGEEKIHGFDGVPATEYRENEEEIGIFEPVLTMINEYRNATAKSERRRLFCRRLYEGFGRTGK